MATVGDVVQFRARPSETPLDGSGGDGPNVVTIRIKLDLGDLLDAPEPPDRHVRAAAKAGGFWSGTIMTLTLIFIVLLW